MISNWNIPNMYKSRRVNQRLDKIDVQSCAQQSLRDGRQLEEVTVISRYIAI